MRPATREEYAQAIQAPGLISQETSTQFRSVMQWIDSAGVVVAQATYIQGKASYQVR